MKQFFPLLLLCLSGMPLESPAQTWLANDHIWTYNISGGFAGVNDHFTMHADIDTVIHGQACKKIRFSAQTNYFPGARFAYAEGEQVYAYQAHADSFVTIYDFSLLPGDTMTVLQPFGTFQYRIEALDTVQAGSLTLRRQQVRYLATSGIFANWKFDILEGIGAVGQPFQDSLPSCSFFFLDEFPFCNSPVDGFDLKFTCFQSNAGSFTPYGMDCLLLDTDAPDLQSLVHIRPNPANDWLYLEASDLPVTSLRTLIFNAQGQMLQMELGLPNRIRLDGFRQGVYFLVLELENGQRLVRRLVKM